MDKLGCMVLWILFFPIMLFGKAILEVNGEYAVRFPVTNKPNPFLSRYDPEKRILPYDA